jgi:hypothetical protein
MYKRAAGTNDNETYRKPHILVSESMKNRQEGVRSRAISQLGLCDGNLVFKSARSAVVALDLIF